MKKPELDDDLRDEYDLKSLHVRRLGLGRKSFGGSTVRIETDVAEIFPDAEAVNEALRFLIRIMKQNELTAFAAQSGSILEQTDENA